VETETPSRERKSGKTGIKYMVGSVVTF